MKKAISLILILALCVGVMAVVLAAAEEPEFEIDENGVLTKYNGKGGDVVIPNGVTSIGESAFSHRSSLKSVTIPDGVTSIGKDAFFFCSNLTILSLPDGLTDIETGAFFDCYNLTNVVLPNTVTSIGNSAFANCYSLESVVIPNSVTSILFGVFSDCNSLTNVTIPNSVTSIGRMAFSRCSSLTSLIIPSSVTSIGDGAFSECNGLTNMTISNGVTSIGEMAFSRCSNLKSITIPNSVNSIGEGAFAYCSGLTNLNVAPDNPFYKSVDNMLLTKDGSKLIYCPPGKTGFYRIPNGITSIGGYAFARFYDLTSVIIPDAVTQIGPFAFESCGGLTSVTIMNSSTSIGGYAFLGCLALSDVYYGGNEEQWKAITSVNEMYSLTSATIHFNTVPLPVPVQPSVLTEDPWITGATCMGDTLTLTAKDGVTAPVFLAAYDESGRMAGIYQAECVDGAYTLPIGADAAKYEWKLMFVDAKNASPLTCAYLLDFTA